MKRKVVIAGAGISGLSLGRMLGDVHDLLILEKKHHAGGLIHCERISGMLFHRVGGHIFNSKEQEVLDWFWAQFDRKTEFLTAKRNAKIWMGGEFIGYPIEDHLYQLPGDDVDRIINELLDNERNQPSGAFLSFGDFLEGNFGPTLYERYFGPYNTKLWNTDLKEVPLDWLDGKLPMPDIRSIMRNNILREAESSLVHATFYYPVRNGSQFIVDRLAEGLNIRYSTPLTAVSFSPAGKIIVNDGEFEADELVYCGDIRLLASIVRGANDGLANVLERARRLRSNATSNVLCMTDDTDASWLYIPDKEFTAHRIIYTGNFSATNNGTAARKTCVVEFSGQVTEDEMRAELQKLPGNLEAVAFNYEPDSYVIQDASTRETVNLLKSLLAPLGIHLLGRFAEWEYYNMDKCISGAMRLKTVLGR